MNILNSYVYRLTCGFIASIYAFNLLTCAFNLATRTFSLLTRRFELITCGFEIVTCEFELVTHGLKLVARGIKLVTRRFELVTHISELVVCNSCFTFPHSNKTINNCFSVFILQRFNSSIVGEKTYDAQQIFNTSILRRL